MNVALIPKQHSHDSLRGINAEIMNLFSIRFQDVLFKSMRLKVCLLYIQQNELIILVKNANVLTGLVGFNKARN